MKISPEDTNIICIIIKIITLKHAYTSYILCAPLRPSRQYILKHPHTNLITITEICMVFYSLRCTSTKIVSFFWYFTELLPLY